MSKKRYPIKRLDKFYGWEDFEIEKLMGREWVEGDINMRVILYPVDHVITDTDDLYGEVDSQQISFKNPIEISCMVKLEPKTNKKYNPNGTLRYEEWGNLTFSVYEDHLEELGVEINTGDYIGYPVREDYIKYFEVTDTDNINDDTERLLGGKIGFYRKIICTPVDDGVFNGV